jgi:hypothetical protein
MSWRGYFFSSIKKIKASKKPFHILGENKTVDTLAIAKFRVSYSSLGRPVYKDKALKIPFIGTDLVSPYTLFYVTFEEYNNLAALVRSSGQY